jgi:hypothetical protein
VAQDGGSDGFVGVDTGFLTPGQQAQQQGSQEDDYGSSRVWHRYMKYIRQI